MLPEPHRLHHHSDFSRTVRRGHRVGRRDVVVHALFVDVSVPTVGSPRDAELARIGGPRVGLIVNKAVGSAVVRHRVSRRLRHICAQLFADMACEVDSTAVTDASATDLRPGEKTRSEAAHPLRDVDLVIRALPSAALATSADLTQQLRSGMRSALARRTGK